MNARNISRKTIIRHLQIYNNASYQYMYGMNKNFFAKNRIFRGVFFKAVPKILRRALRFRP